MQKGFSLILALVGVAFITVIAGGIFYLGRVTTPKPQIQNPTVTSTTQPTSSPITASTSNLQVYKNTTYNYSLEVPTDWSIDKQNAAQNNDGLVFMYSGDFKVVGDTQVPHLSKGSQLEIVASKGYKSYEDLIGKESSDPTYTNKQETTVAGEKATLWTSNNAYNIPGQKGYKYAFFRSGTGYSISITSATSDDSLFRQILSTFKFTGQTDKTENWKTYTNNIFGYKIKYPADWYVAGPYRGQAGYGCLENPENVTIAEFSKTKLTDCGFLAEQLPPKDADVTIWVNNKEWEKLNILNEPYKDTSVAGEKAMKYVFTEKSQLPNIQATRIYFNHNGKGYLIFLMQTDKRDNYNPVYDQVLSTFKFIN